MKRTTYWDDPARLAALSWSRALEKGVARGPAPAAWVGPALEARIVAAVHDDVERRALDAALDRFEIAQREGPVSAAPFLVSLIALLWSGASAAFAAVGTAGYISAIVVGTVALYVAVAAFWLSEAVHHVILGTRRRDRAAAALEVRRIIRAASTRRRSWWSRVARP